MKVIFTGIGIIFVLIVIAIVLLMSVGCNLETEITTDNAEQIESNEAKNSEEPTEFKAPFKIKHHIKGLDITVTKIENDDLLALLSRLQISLQNIYHKHQRAVFVCKLL